MLDRIARRAETTAKTIAAHHGTMDILAETLTEADIVITAFGEGRTVLTAEMVSRALVKRRYRPIFLVDLSIPADIDPAVNRIDEAFLFDLEDLERSATEGKNARRAEAEAACELVDTAVVRFLSDQSGRIAAPSIARLRAHLETMREELHAEQPNLSAEDATRLLLKRVLHGPSEHLRHLAATDNLDDRTLSTLEDLFGLDDITRRDPVSLQANLERVLARHRELEAILASGDSSDIATLSKELSELAPVAQKVTELNNVRRELSEARELLEDPDMADMADEEVQRLEKALPALERDVQILLLPKDEADEKNAILEVRAGTGGDEAALFATGLFGMYQRYAALRGWKFEIMEISENDIGGYKEAIAEITGRSVFLRASSSSPASTGSSASLLPSPAAAYIPRLRPLQCCPKPRMLTSISRTGISVLTCSVPAVLAVSTSTRRKAQCV